MKKLRSLLYGFWANHVQKTFASILIGGSLFDFADAFLQFGGNLSHLLGPHVYHPLRAACASIILARALIRPRLKQGNLQ